MTYAPKLLDRIEDESIKHHLKRLICEPLKYMDEFGSNPQTLSKDPDINQLEIMVEDQDNYIGKLEENIMALHN